MQIKPPKILLALKLSILFTAVLAGLPSEAKCFLESGGIRCWDGNFQHTIAIPRRLKPNIFEYQHIVLELRNEASFSQFFLERDYQINCKELTYSVILARAKNFENSPYVKEAKAKPVLNQTKNIMPNSEQQTVCTLRQLFEDKKLPLKAVSTTLHVDMYK